MRRGRSQATYRYLPGMFIDFDDGNCIAYIDRWDSYEVKEGVNIIRIVKELQKGLFRYADGGKIFKDKTAEDFVILSPRYGIDVELAPLTFICSKCRLAHSFFNLSHFERTTRGKFNCTSCGGKLKQLDLIYRHTCGFAGLIQVRACPVHGKNNMRLVRGASIGEFRWVCGKCGHKISLNTKCPACNHPGKYIYPVPFRQGDVYMRKGLSMINLPFIDEEKLYSDPLSAKMIIGEYLGITKRYGFTAKELLDTTKEARLKEYEILKSRLSKKNLRNVPKVSDAYYLYDYHPRTMRADNIQIPNPKHDSNSQFILVNIKIKKKNESINKMALEISKQLGNLSLFTICTIPPSDIHSPDSGIKLIAKELCKNGCKDGTDCIKRKYSIPPQHKSFPKLSTNELKASLTIENKDLIIDKNILLLDDIATTGNSLESARQLLLENKAKFVICLVLAKTT